MLLHRFRRELAAPSTARAIGRVWRLGWVDSFVLQYSDSRHGAEYAGVQVVRMRAKASGRIVRVAEAVPSVD